MNIVLDSNFFQKWQTLIGSALGPFLAIMLSATAFFIKEKLTKRKNGKEAIRRLEIALTKTLNDIFTSVSQIEFFLDRAKQIAQEIKNIKDETTYALQRTNFPPVINIYFDEEWHAPLSSDIFFHINQPLAARA